MPFFEVGITQSNVDAALNNGIQIFDRTYGHGPTKVLLIIGLAGTHDSWDPQIKGLTGTDRPNDDETFVFDQEPGIGHNEVGGIELNRKTLSIAIRFLKAKTPEQRAVVDLDTHYSEEYLEEYVGSNTRRAILYQEYVKGITVSGMQSNYGFDGQINACWTHKMSRTEIELIRSSGFLVSIIHGRKDVIAQINHARRLVEKLRPVARMAELHGGASSKS